MPSQISDYRLFWQEFRRTFQSTGAILPSGRRLCKALASRIVDADPPRRILEVGPGTGVVTRHIAAQMGADDTLDLVEMNDRFVALLRDRLDADVQLREIAQRTKIHHLPIEQFESSRPFDAIVSGLPLNNFPARLVRSILADLGRLAAPGATLSFFEYVGVRKAKSLISAKSERRRLAGVDKVLSEALSNWRIDRACIVANAPPAWVHHLRFHEAPAQLQETGA